MRYLQLPSLMGLAAAVLLTGCATGLMADGEHIPLARPTGPSIVRVRLLTTSHPSNINCSAGCRFGSLQSRLSKETKSALKIRASGKYIYVGSKRLSGDLIVTPDDPSRSLVLNGRHYRGSLVIHPLGGRRYDIVEYMEMNEYLYGVLPKEVDATWHLESLKAQAVVSRSYALASKRARVNERFDLAATVLDQVYGGQDSEKAECNQAVDETREFVLMDSQDQPVRAFFHAACGGKTDKPQFVWKTAAAQDVYEVVSDHEFCSDYPRQKWKLVLSLNSLRDRLRRAGLRVRSVSGVSVLQKSPSGRSQVFILQTSKGEVQVASNRFRLALGPEALRSTYLTNITVKHRNVYFEGLGWGHGVGMCQWGAQGRAKAGQTYDEILKAYYPRGKVVRL